MRNEISQLVLFVFKKNSLSSQIVESFLLNETTANAVDIDWFRKLGYVYNLGVAQFVVHRGAPRVGDRTG